MIQLQQMLQAITQVGLALLIQVMQDLQQEITSALPLHWIARATV